MQLDLARTSGVCRWLINNSGDYSTGMASVCAQKCERDKPAFHVAFSTRRYLLVGLWSIIKVEPNNHLECNIIGSYVHDAICKDEVWQIIKADKSTFTCH